MLWKNRPCGLQASKTHSRLRKKFYALLPEREKIPYYPEVQMSHCPTVDVAAMSRGLRWSLVFFRCVPWSHDVVCPLLCFLESCSPHVQLSLNIVEFVCMMTIKTCVTMSDDGSIKPMNRISLQSLSWRRRRCSKFQ